jgi:lysophospholipase L1-like esterase
MRNVNGAINIILFQRDEIHLNAKGTNMIAFRIIAGGETASPSSEA